MRSLAGDSELMTDAQTLARDLEAAGKLCSVPPPPSDEQIARLAQQERQAQFAAAADEDDEPAPPLDPETERLVTAMVALPIDHTPAGMWVLRRFGYTAAMNPQNMLMVMSGEGGTVGAPAQTAQLDPTAAECVQIVEERAQAAGMRPRSVHVDCASAVQ